MANTVQSLVIKSVTIQDDHRLVIELPGDVQPGLVDVEIVVWRVDPRNVTRDLLRERMRANRMLGTSHASRVPITAPSEKSLLQAGELLPGAPDTTAIIHDLRGM